MMGQIHKDVFKEKVETSTWMEENTQNLFALIKRSGVLWIPSIANVFPLLDGDNYGNKVQIKRFDHIPNTIELVGKTCQMICEKRANNVRWKLWHVHVNIKVSSSLSPFT
jgi:hypothetical protein